MSAVECLKRWSVAILIAAVAMPLWAASPPAAPSPAAPAEAKRAEGAKKPAKPRVRVTISKETTYLTEPLRPDGYVDYVAALNQRQSQGVTPENNAAVLFWKVMGPGEISEHYRERYLQMLGIPALPPEGDYFIDLDKYAKLDQPTADQEAVNKLWDDLSAATSRPWKKSEFPVLAGWIEANEMRMPTLVEGTKCPRCYEPMVGEEGTVLIAVLLPGVQQYRDIARVLAARAMLRLGSGEVDAAWDDLLACHRLARLASQGPTLVDQLVAIAIDGIACAGDQALVQHPGLTARRAKRMYADLGSLPPMRKMVECVDTTERFMFLDCVQLIASEGLSAAYELTGGGSGGAAEDSLMRALCALATSMIDWDVALRMGNSWFDQLVEAYRKPTRGERAEAMQRIDEDTRRLFEEFRDTKSWAVVVVIPHHVLSKKMGQVFVSLLLPAVGAATTAEDRGAMQREVTRLGFALAAYRAEHGAYPEKLAELSPQYVAEVPKDLFSGGELVYRRQPGGFLLYSVGANGKDDGGRGQDDHTDAEEAQVGDDLAIRVPAKPRPKQ